MSSGKGSKSEAMRQVEGTEDSGNPQLLSLASENALAANENGLLSIQSLKQRAKHTVKQVVKPDVSRFQHWESPLIRELLVQYDIEVRGANRAPHDFLVKVAEEVFEGKPMPPPPPSLSLTETVQLTRAALRIQHNYIKNKASQIEEQYRVAHEQQNRRLMGHRGVEPDMSEHSGRRGSVSHRRASTADHQRAAEASMMSKCKHHKKGNVTQLNRKELQDEMETEWLPPTIRYSQKFYLLNHPHKAGQDMKPYEYKKATLGRHCVIGGCGEQLDLWDEGQVSEFGQFGSGITNYFKFLKWCTWIFFCLAIMNTPALIMNCLGAGNQYEGFNLAVMSVGNLGDSVNVTVVDLPFCNGDDFQQFDCTIKKSDLAYYYSLLDVLGTAFVLIGWLWLRRFEKMERENLDRATVTASDYTVRLPWVPKDTQEMELKAHFAKVTGEPVADVQLAFNNAKEIQLYFRRGELMKERFHAVQQLRYHYTQIKKHGEHSGGSADEIKYLTKERDKISKKIEELDTERAIHVKTFPNAIQAFVTFETEKGFIKAIKAYSLSSYRRLCYPRGLRFRGSKLKVKEAPEPSTILWENLEYSNFDRIVRKGKTTAVAFLAILLSIVAALFAREVQETALDEGGKQECPMVWGDLSNEEKANRVTSVEGSSPILHCFCDELGFIEQYNDANCKDYVKAKTISLLTVIGACATVTGMNTFFTWLMNKSGRYEKHQSMDSMEASIMSRTFILKFVNTGCLVLLYNQQWLKNALGISLSVDPDFSKSWYETGGQTLMGIMFATIWSPHISPWMRMRAMKKKMQSIVSGKVVLKGDDDYPDYYTQDDLNAAFLGPEFHMDLRYSQALVNFFICFMYMAGMPAMLWIGCACFYVNYWMDKYLFCNFYRIPPQYSDTMGRMATQLLGLSIITHLLMSIWIMGNKAIFVSEAFDAGTAVEEYESSYNPLKLLDSDNLEQRHIIPLAVFLVLIVAVWIINQQTKEFTHFTKNIINFITCGSGSKTETLMSTMNTVDVTYTRAKQRGLIKGLNTYNILRNPKYQEAFNIDGEFAAKHRHVTSIRKLNLNNRSMSTENRAQGQWVERGDSAL